MSKYQCEYCSKEFKKKQHLENHLKRKKKCYECIQCTRCYKIFNTQQHLEIHLKNKKDCTQNINYYINLIEKLNTTILNLTNKISNLEKENLELKKIVCTKEKYINNLQLFN